MKEKFKVLKADILDELESLGRLKKEYLHFVEDVDLENPDVYQRAVIGYYLHNFYNGCENIFKLIATFFENTLPEDSWHTNLLKRMKLEIEGLRPRVIDNVLYKILDDFRSFRHVFRKAYSFELDWEKEKIVAGKFQNAHDELDRQIKGFLERLEKFVAGEVKD